MDLLVNTRKYRRFAEKLMVKITSGSLKFWAVTSNISQKGLCIRANQEFPVNKVLTIDLIMPDGQISAIRGMVKHVNESPHSQRKFGIGLEIIEDDTTFRDYLEDLERKTVLYAKHEAKSEHTHDMQKDDFAYQASEIPESSRLSHQAGEEPREQEGHAEEPEEEMREPAYTLSTGDRPSRSELGKDRDRRTGILPLLLILIILLLVTGTGGMILYRSFMQDRDIQPAKELICSIQVGAFKSEANAQVLFQKFKDKGYNVFIDKSDVKDQGIMYKVLIGPFQQIGDTARAAEDIRAKENIDPFVLCK